MFSSEEWEKCKFSNTVKGKSAYAIVVSPSFWTGVKLCLKVFAPLVKVLRMVEADSKPSMGFIYGELKKAKNEIIDALNDNKKAYEPIMDIISEKSSGWLDTSLHMAAYILNPYYLYNNLEVKNDIDAVVDVVGKLFPEDYDTQNQIMMVEFQMYKRKQGTFDQVVASKECEVNDDKFDPANWWSKYGGSTPHLRKIAMRILSLTTSSSECERNWSTYIEGVRPKKRNLLEATKRKKLEFVQFSANLMEKNKKRKARSHEVLLEQDASDVQEWIVEGDVDDASARSRDLFDEEFKSASEEEVDEEVE